MFLCVFTFLQAALDEASAESKYLAQKFGDDAAALSEALLKSTDAAESFASEAVRLGFLTQDLETERIALNVALKQGEQMTRELTKIDALRCVNASTQPYLLTQVATMETVATGEAIFTAALRLVTQKLRANVERAELDTETHNEHARRMVTEISRAAKDLTNFNIGSAKKSWWLPPSRIEEDMYTGRRETAAGEEVVLCGACDDDLRGCHEESESRIKSLTLPSADERTVADLTAALNAASERSTYYKNVAKKLFHRMKRQREVFKAQRQA